MRYAAKTHAQSSIAWFSRQIKIRFRWKVRSGQSLAKTSGWAPTVRWFSRNRRSMDLINPGLGCLGPYKRRSTVMPPLSPLLQQGRQYGCHSLLGNACLDYVPQVHTYGEMQQRLELDRQLAPYLQGASQTWQANLCIDWPVKPVNPPRTLNVMLQTTPAVLLGLLLSRGTAVPRRRAPPGQGGFVP